MPYIATTATRKILSLKKRIRAVSGGTSSSKTISILMWLMDYAQSTSDQIITVVAESVPHLELGAIRDFKSIMNAHNYWNEARWISKPAKYTFETGSIIEFISFDKFGKAHGPRRDVLFINEANNIPYDIADQLITRTRKIVWLDWNPSSDFWFYEEMLGKRDDVEFIGENGDIEPLTYLDNEALLDEPGQVTIKEIESHRMNQSWWRVYGEGRRGEVEGRIYKDWQIIDDIPHEARLERYGLDFGYAIDPTAIVAVYYYNGGYIIDEIAYQKELSNKTIADILKNSPQGLVVADSAEPKSIQELQMYGVSVIPCSKGPGSVNRGINYVQSQRISVTKKSLNVIKAYRNYLYLKTKDGKWTNEPDDTIHEWSNTMDAVRYAVESFNPPKKRRAPISYQGGDPYTGYGAIPRYGSGG